MIFAECGMILSQQKPPISENTIIFQTKTPGCYVKARLVLAIMMSFGGFTVYALRIGINIAILKMVSDIS